MIIRAKNIFFSMFKLKNLLTFFWIPNYYLLFSYRKIGFKQRLVFKDLLQKHTNIIICNIYKFSFYIYEETLANYVQAGI